MFKTVFQPFYTLYVIVSFIVSLLLIYPTIVLCTLVFGSKSGSIVQSVIANWSKFWLRIIGMRPTVIGKLPGKDKRIIVANHISYLDTLLIFAIIPGYFKPLGKIEITKIPLLGFIYKILVITVDRADAGSRANSIRQMLRTLNENCSVVLFPEGTFNETPEPLKTFHNGAFRLAIISQVNIVPVIFPDTVNRWHYSAWWKLWPGRNRAIILDEVPVGGYNLRQLDQYKEIVFKKMQEALAKHSER